MRVPFVRGATKVCEHKLLLWVLVSFSVISIILCIHVKQNFQVKIDYQREFESPLTYVWNSTDGEVSLAQNSVTLSFEGDSQKIYFYLFDRQKAPESELAVVPDAVSKIQFDCLLYLKPGLTITAYIQQFDEAGVRIEEATKIERINTNTIRVNGNKYGNFPYSISARKAGSCKTYNVLFDIRPNGEDGLVRLQDVDIIMH